jgi:hypothetical protein
MIWSVVKAHAGCFCSAMNAIEIRVYDARISRETTSILEDIAA